MDERTIIHIPARPPSIPTIDRPFRVAAYCRVSSPSEEQELSLETQVTYYTDKINGNPLWINAGVFADTTTSRNTKERTGFKKLLAKCYTGKVDFILTKAISRFGRNSLDTIKALRELRSHGVDVYFEQGNIHLLDPTAQHAMEVYCALVQNESKNKSHNIKWGIKVGFEQGTSGYQHFACYGFRFDEMEQTLVIVPHEAEVVKLIFNLRLRCYSYGKISTALAAERIQSPTGKPIWSRECIRKGL